MWAFLIATAIPPTLSRVRSSTITKMFCGNRGAFDERRWIVGTRPPDHLGSSFLCQEVKRQRIAPTVVGVFSRAPREGAGGANKTDALRDASIARSTPSFWAQRPRACLFPHRHLNPILTTNQNNVYISTTMRTTRSQNIRALEGLQNGHSGLWMPHASTASPRQFGLVLGGILRFPCSIWSRCADGSSPGPTLVRNRCRCNKKP